MSKHRVPLLLALSLAFVLGCAEQPPAHGCQTDGQCAVGSRCSGGVCRADTRPTASISDVGEVEEFALVRLDGSTSTHPEGKHFEHHWSVRSIDAPCAPPEIAGLEAVAQVRFGCAGRYEVSLVVTDDLAVASDPARREVTVRRSSASPIVKTGADLAVDHRCAGTPLRCTPTLSSIKLSANAAAGASLRWTVQPPAERPLDATRRVVFSPSANAPAPTVVIETDGTAISGDWIFRAEVVDAHGVVGAAHTRVSVRNRPPVVSFTTPPAPFPHVFDAAQGQFTSEGAVTWHIVDPDGDPVEEIWGTWRHVGDGDASVFDGDFDGPRVTFEVQVPYATPADGLLLRGGPDLVRQIEISAVDVNRTVGTGVIPIEIGNQPPAFVGGAFDTSVPHRYDPERRRYVAWARVGTFVDPDGDPIVDSAGPGVCGTLRAVGNDVLAECTVPFEGYPALDRLAGVRTFSAAARDPWDAAIVVPVRTVEIRNTPPSVTAGPPSVATVDVRLSVILGNCVMDLLFAPVTFDVTVDVSDADGDPVAVTATTPAGGRVSPAGMLLAAPTQIPFHFDQAAYWWHCWKADVRPNLSAVNGSDGAANTLIGVSPDAYLHD